MKNEDFIFIKKMFRKRKKFKQYLKINGKVICRIKDIKITKNKVPYILPVFNENSPGWNQGIQDVFKKFPPIPIDTRIYQEDVHNTLTSLTGEIAKAVNLPESFLGYKIKDISIPHAINVSITRGCPKHERMENNQMKNKNLDEVMFHMISNLYKKIQNHNIKKMFTDVIISLDWDDVMYHLMQKNIEFVEKEYGIKDVHNEITDYYYLYRTYPKIADELWNHPENYISGGLIDGAKEFYQELVNLVGEDKIQIVTSSMENVIPLKDKMIRERFGINCKIVHSVFGKHKKYEFTKDTLLIDDFVGNIREHYIHNLNYGIVFNHMNLDYIKKESEEEGLLHVATFEEVIEKVKVYLELGKDYLPNVESCPYCEKDLYNLKFKPYITKTECPYCKNTVVLERGWICEPECPSAGMTVYYLYTLEDAKELALDIEGD